MKSPNHLSEKELWDYAEAHLQYEIEMLNGSVGILASIGTRKNEKPVSWVLNNGILNTFSTHARNLIDFLYSRTKGKDFPTDIIIQDYADEKDISKHLIEITPVLEEALVKANKQVAHLSMERIDFEIANKEWKFIEVLGHIRNAFSSIAPYIPNQKMSENLRDKLSQKSVKIFHVDITTLYSQSGQESGVCLSLREQEILKK